MPLANRMILHNLSFRLILAFVTIIFLATITAGVPAYWLISTELERQAWAHVTDGARVTQALLSAEQERMANLATLAAQRPTLQRLMHEGEKASLVDYLYTFSIGVDLDILVVRDAGGSLIADAISSPSWPDPPYDTEIAFYASPTPVPSLALVASRPVYMDQSDLLLGYVTLGILLDDVFTYRLAIETGYEQSIVMETSRIASSLPSTQTSIDSEVYSQVVSSNQSREIDETIQGAHYFTSLRPIHDAEDKVIALSEVALPVDTLLDVEQRALSILILSTLLVVIVGSATGGFIAHRLTRPLGQLTDSATKISRGDLETPVPNFVDPYEISTLATTLDESRINLKRVLENLSNAKAWSETLIQSILEGIITINDEGRITSFSHGAERITGYSQSQVLEQPIDQILRLPHEEGLFTAHLPPQGKTRHMDILTTSGRRVTLAVTNTQLMSPTIESSQMALVIRDITEEEAAQNLRSYFLANISHEFRTPLSAINASVELLLDDLEDLSTAEISELLNSIHMSVSGLQTLIDNLLESLSIEAGRFSIHRRRTDLNKIVIDAVRMMTPLLNRRQQRLTVEEPDELPQVYADPTRLTQVLVNLLSNASKYGPIKREIELTIRKIDERFLRIAVADRGSGVSPLDRKDIFRRFVRLESHAGAQYGIGLGLSVVKAIVDEHGGEVGVEPRPDGGSIFWFTIPLFGGDA